MRRTKRIKTPSAILASDLHIRNDTPICRTDDYAEEQRKKLHFIFELCEVNKCPLLIGGDIGHVSQWPNKLLSSFISIVKKYDIDIFGIPGQHDLPQHRVENLDKSGCGVLDACGIIKMINIPTVYKNKFIIYPFPWGKKMENPSESDIPSIAMSHQMVIKNRPLWPGQKAPKGSSLLDKFDKYQLILTGDNHNQFVISKEGRNLVNPGSMMRMTAAQQEFRPSVYKWFIETNAIVQVELPISNDVVSRDHIDKKKEKDVCMSSFTNKISGDIEINLSFEGNIERYLNGNRVKKQVLDKILEAMDNG